MLAIKDNYHIFMIRLYLFSLKLTSALPTRNFFPFFSYYMNFQNLFCHL